MNRKLLYLSLMITLLFLPLVSAGWYTDDVFPYVHYLNDQPDELWKLEYEQQRIALGEVYDADMALIEQTNLEELLHSVSLVVEAIDTGLDKGQGVSLDWSQEGITHQCLTINVDKNFLFSKNGKVYLREMSVEGTKITGVSVSKKQTKENVYQVTKERCTIEQGGNLENGSLDLQNVCTKENRTETRTDVEWLKIPITKSFIFQDGRQDSFTVDEDGEYRYCFDLPIEKEKDGYGSKGTAYFEIADEVYVDRQHSSFWNTTFPYHRDLNISNQLSPDTLRRYSTIEVSGWDTTDTSRFNATQPSNFEVVCENITVSAIVGNKTDLRSNANGSKLYSDSTGWFTTNTTFLFRLPQNISATSSNSTMCAVYYGILSFNSTSYNMSQMALLYDDFNRDNSGTPGNGWNGSGISFNVTNSSLRAGSANSVTDRVLDTGECNDCEQYEILYEYSMGGASNGSGMCIGFDNNGTLDGATAQCALSGSASQGVLSNPSDESATWQIGTSFNATLIKTEPFDISNTANYTIRLRGLDDDIRGDYQMFMNETLIEFNTNLTCPDCANGVKRQVRSLANRAGNRINYIMIKRWQPIPPTITFQAEENSIQETPTQGKPIINATSANNLTTDNLTIYNVSTADNDSNPVKNIFFFGASTEYLGRRYNPINIPMDVAQGTNSTAVVNYKINTSLAGDIGNGTVVGGAVLNGSGGYDSFGAYDFDGINDIIEIRDGSTSLNLMKNITLDFRFRRGGNGTVVNNKDAIFAKGGGAPNGWTAGYFPGNSTFVFTFQSQDFHTLSTISNNVWYHVTVVAISGQNISIYIDGLLNRTFTTTQTIGNNAVNSTIGGLQTGASAYGGFFNGTVDEVRLYNATFGAQEVWWLHINETNRVHSRQTERGENWTGCVIPNDNNTDGGRQCVGISIDDIPTLNLVGLNTTDPNNRTNGSLQVTLNVTNTDGQALTNHTIWFRNGNLTEDMASLRNLTVVSDNYTVKKDNWTVMVRVCDPFNQCTSNLTGNVTITNTPAELNSINLSSDTTQNYSNSNLTGAVAFTDIDNDSFTFTEYSWLNNSLRVPSVANRTIVNNLNTTRLQIWSFTARTFDGDNFSIWVNSTNHTVRNFLPNISDRTPWWNQSTYHITQPFNCSLNLDRIDNDSVFVEHWVGNRSAGDWQLRQNTTTNTSTNYTFTWNANYTVEWNCKIHDSVNSSAFNSTNVSIDFNNSLVYGNRSVFSATVQSGGNQTYRLNISWNGIAVRDIYANFTIDQNRTVIPAEQNISGENSSHFLSSYVTAINGTNYNITFYWNISIELWNGTIISPVLRDGDYQQQATAISLYVAGCNGTTNLTQWAIWNVTFGDEGNQTNFNASLDGTLSFYAIGTDRSNNFTTSFGTINVNQTFICLTPNNQTNEYGTYGLFRYTRSGFDPREYYFVNTTVDNFTDNIRLYLLEISLATGIVHTVQNEIDAPLAQRYIFVERYDVNNNSYRIVAGGKTSDAGEDNIFLRQNDVFYRYRIQEDTKVIYLSDPRKITSTNLIFTIRPGGVFDQLKTAAGTSYNLSYNNETRTFRLTFVNTDTTVQQACLDVKRISFRNGTDVVCHECSTSSSGTMTCDLSNNISGEYTGTFYIHVGPGSLDKVIASVQGFINHSKIFSGLLGRNAHWLNLVFIGTLAFAGLISPVASIVLLVVGLLLSVAMGTLNLAQSTIWVLIVVAGIIISRLKK